MTVDLLAFGGSAALAMILVAIGWANGLLSSETPEWTWVTAVLLVDVAHVYATGFRVYFIPQELKRRPWLYALTPLLSYLLGMCIYSESEAWFWRCLAYLAVFHFVRQQAGWVALYRSKVGESRGGWLDFATIYVATIWPLLWWHDHLPRGFWWFREDDFFSNATFFSDALRPVYLSLLVAYLGKSLVALIFKKGLWNPGKDLVVVSTAICWYVGIVYLNSDYAFTVTNVLIHGIPYMVLVHWFHNRVQADADSDSDANHTPAKMPQFGKLQRWLKYLCVIWILAYAEEYFWDRGLWHERAWLFGAGWEWSLEWEGVRTILVPLLAVPQLTHYILDGFIWKRRVNPVVNELTDSSVQASRSLPLRQF